MAAKPHVNKPCPCGSGIKYKKCCGNPLSIKQPLPRNLDKEIRRIRNVHMAKEKQRQKQQGLGHPIVSTEFKGYRIVAVGNTLFWEKEKGQWRTFHDFLQFYIVHKLKGKWAELEEAKPIEEKHPLLQWYHAWLEIRKSTKASPDGTYSAPMTGAIAGYLGLAYNLYLIAHNNTDIQTRLIKRLQRKEDFHGAYYECFVAAQFIKAGFELEYEDETDGNSTHYEFTAISKATGMRYSVEAKTRSAAGVLGKREGKATVEDPNVRNQLHKALLKEAKHTRIIFIDVNVPDTETKSEENLFLVDAIRTVHAAESTLTIHGEPAPPAYVILTNHPYDYSRNETKFRTSVLVDAFKITDFVFREPQPLKTHIEAREKHIDMYSLLQAMKDINEIPSTFDGENPEFAFGNKDYPRLIIGNKYLVPDKNGRQVPAELTDAVVMVNEKKCMGVYTFPDGTSGMVSTPLLETEIAAYRRHPETFFGVFKNKQKADSPLELYDFLLDSFKKYSRENLLKMMKDYPDQELLKRMSNLELSKLHAEMMANHILVMGQPK